MGYEYAWHIFTYLEAIQLYSPCIPLHIGIHSLQTDKVFGPSVVVSQSKGLFSCVGRSSFVYICPGILLPG